MYFQSDANCANTLGFVCERANYTGIQTNKDVVLPLSFTNGNAGACKPGYTTFESKLSFSRLIEDCAICFKFETKISSSNNRQYR